MMLLRRAAGSDLRRPARSLFRESLRDDAEDTRRDEGQTVAFLAQLAGGRSALELAVGTGQSRRVGGWPRHVAAWVSARGRSLMAGFR